MHEKCLLSSRPMSFLVMPTSYRENKVFLLLAANRARIIISKEIRVRFKKSSTVIGGIQKPGSLGRFRIWFRYFSLDTIFVRWDKFLLGFIQSFNTVDMILSTGIASSYFICLQQNCHQPKNVTFHKIERPLLRINSMKSSIIFLLCYQLTSMMGISFFPGYQIFLLAGHRSRVPDVT